MTIGRWSRDHRAVVAEILGEKNGTAALVFANLAGIDPSIRIGTIGTIGTVGTILTISRKVQTIC